MIGIGRSPYMSEDALMREHTSMIGSKIGKQFVFGAGQFDFLFAVFHNMPGKINGKWSRLDNFVLRCPASCACAE